MSTITEAAPLRAYHYTTGFSLPCILDAGCIEPGRLSADRDEIPVVWLSRSPTGEPTAAVLKNLLGTDWGQWRIQVKLSVAEKIWTIEQWKMNAGCSSESVKHVEASAGHKDWLVHAGPIPCGQWNNLEVLRDGGWEEIPQGPLRLALDFLFERRNGKSARPSGPRSFNFCPE